MITNVLLKSLGFEDEDISYILECDEKYRNAVKPLSDEFMSTNGFQDMKPYTAEQGEAKYAYAIKMLEEAEKCVSDCDNPRVLKLLFWLYCVPCAEQYYKEHNIDMKIFYDTMSDLSCKNNECKERYGKVGMDSPWFYLHLDFIYFALGRLQYYIESYRHDTYKFESYELKEGDLVYSCHIPSGGKLTPELCMESLDKAYEFFKDELKDDILPIECRSWLLFQNYVGKAYPKGSNLEKFALMFDIIETRDTGREFKDCIRVFNVPFNGSTEGFPADNSLRRGFIEYINSGATFGSATGILLYDGKKKEIINKPQN